MKKSLILYLIVLASLLSSCSEQIESSGNGLDKTTPLHKSFTKPIIELTASNGKKSYSFGIKSCRVYRAVQTQNSTADWELLFKPTFYALPTMCVVERLELEGEYLHIEIGTQAIGAGGCCTTYAAYRSLDGETWEIRPATSIKDWQINGDF